MTTPPIDLRPVPPEHRPVTARPGGGPGGARAALRRRMRDVELRTGRLSPGRSLSLAILVLADLLPHDDGLSVTASRARWERGSRVATVRVDPSGVVLSMGVVGHGRPVGPHPDVVTSSHRPGPLAGLLDAARCWLADGASAGRGRCL